MHPHPLAGQIIPEENLVDVASIIAAYYDFNPDASRLDQCISFGTSGHRGRSLDRNFNESHILAVTQAVCDVRKDLGVDGPVMVGMDTHALSAPALRTVVEVLAGNGITAVCDENKDFTPTPVISHAILNYNDGRSTGLADGLILTPSHNPPDDGGIKYNPPNGGPADTGVTTVIEKRANEILRQGHEVGRVPFEKAWNSSAVTRVDFAASYIASLNSVVNLEAIAGERVRMAADPMGGAGLHYWDRIADAYGLELTVLNASLDPTFSFMRVDRDGKTRMDCSSPYAMAGLIERASNCDIAFGNDPDADRHGIVTPSTGLLNPNHYLAAAIFYLFQHRPLWAGGISIGKTLVSSDMINRVAASLNRSVVEVPVGFKWFVDGLMDGTLGFCGEESAGATFLKKDGHVWSTDKDGIIMNLLAAEMLAVSGKDPGEIYESLTRTHGRPVYERIDVSATREEKARLKSLGKENLGTDAIAGEPIIRKLTKAPGNDKDFGGLKVETENGWFAARPSGTENLYKIYAESFLGEQHLESLQTEAIDLVRAAITS